MKVVIRYRDTKYSEKRVERDKFHGVFNNISVQRRILSEFEPDNDLMNDLNAQETKKINLCDVTSESGERYGAQRFTLSKNWNSKKLTRGQVITFEATIYRLTKLKKKNAQKPGPLEILELRYPDEIKHEDTKDKARLKPRVKDQTLDYRRDRDPGTELDALIDEQVKELLAEHNYEDATAARKAKVRPGRSKKMRKKNGVQRKAKR